MALPICATSLRSRLFRRSSARLQPASSRSNHASASSSIGTAPCESVPDKESRSIPAMQWFVRSLSPFDQMWVIERFREGLRSLGYKITSLQGRVVRGMAIDAPRPAIHMLLQVDLPEGPYLADVGFGNLAPTSALLLKPDVEQDTPHEPMRFIDVGGELTLQAKLRDMWEHIYRVIPYPRYDGEYEITNWYTGTHPDAPYQGNIIAAKPGPNRTRITMFNARLTVRHATGEAERRLLKDEAEFRSVLRGEFGLNMSDDEIRTCISVMERKGEKGAPHPFFA
ncbi:arylamine N-acetyltransferase [Bradyrhizobium sp. SSUT77]|uniref:arylamine N-acetyltransferase family protein n=2 Tax=unclassified Bradyrhizobium TaxID=2631580 RepID=UPI0032665A3C